MWIVHETGNDSRVFTDEYRWKWDKRWVSNVHITQVSFRSGTINTFSGCTLLGLGENRGKREVVGFFSQCFMVGATEASSRV